MCRLHTDVSCSLNGTYALLRALAQADSKALGKTYMASSPLRFFSSMKSAKQVEAPITQYLRTIALVS